MRTGSIIVGVVTFLAVAVGSYSSLQSLKRQAKSLEDGVVAYQKGDYPDAIKLLTPFAENGNKRAQRTLGLAYAYSEDERRDRQRAHTLLRTSLGPKAIDTYIAIAESFESGDDVAEDAEEALAWYRIAADEGSAEAQDRLREPKQD
jgi:TPR repeat protein